jgi:preprotein translocase subunit YajC
MKNTAAIIILSALFLSQTSLTFAVTTTPTTTPVYDMEAKVKALVQENISTTEAQLKQKVDLQTMVGFVGKITTIGSNSLTVDSKGTLLQVKTDTQTTFIKSGSAAKITSLAIGDKIILIGTSLKNDIIQAKKVTVIAEVTSEQVITTAIVAKITAIDTKKKTITLNLNGTNQTLTLSKKSTVKLDTLSTGQTILGIIKEYQGKLSISRAKSI